MADIKPLGSEKLNGDEKLKRILELTYFNQNNKKSNSSSKPELVKESTTGGVFGIVKEKDGYYVKRGKEKGRKEKRKGCGNKSNVIVVRFIHNRISRW